MMFFDGCPELLRGVRLGTVMRYGRRIFGTSQGDARTYALSEVVERLHAFVSHNWSVGRWTKQLCLAYTFNLELAIIVATFTMSCSACVVYYGGIVTYFMYGCQRGMLARIVTIPTTL